MTAAKGRPCCWRLGVERHGLLALSGHLHLTAEPLEHPPGHAQHDVLIIHHQDAAVAVGSCLALAGRFTAGTRGARSGQVEVEAAAVARLGLDGDVAAVLDHHRVDDCKPQPAAPGLGGEVGVEDAGPEDLLGMPVPSSATLISHVAAGGKGQGSAPLTPWHSRR